MAGSANLNLMIQAARKAARRVVRDFGEVENLQVSVKGIGDFVSSADRKSEEIIYEMLSEGRPNYGWLGEESGERKGKDPTRRWIVDPIDGTSNFLHGLPHWSISIGLEHKGDIIAGVVYDPIKDEMFTAEAGQGAWLNDRRLRVSARRETTEMLLGTGVPFGSLGGLPEMMQDLSFLMPRTAGVRRWGTASLDLAYVAAGRLDGYWERGIKPWDMAAGLILVREAGGLVGRVGESRECENPMPSGDVMAAGAEAYRLLSRLGRD
ncbi:MAG: inositol monophosphatase family protein [Pseudomonadota bacterium]